MLIDRCYEHPEWEDWIVRDFKQIQIEFHETSTQL